MFDHSKRVMVIAPHADDESFGCGALLARLSRREVGIHLMLAGCSDVVHRDGAQTAAQQRWEEFQRVGAYLHATCHNCWLPDTHLKSHQPELIRMIESQIASFQPDTLLFPFSSFHQDHQAVYASTFAALRPGMFRCVQRICCYEIVNYVWCTEGQEFLPNLYVTCSREDVQEKIRLCSLHRSQVDRPNSPIVLKMVEEGCRRRGFDIGTEYAEAYRIIRTIY